MKKCYVMMACILFVGQMYGQNEKFKALYIYNFTKYIEWPTSSTDMVFTIVVFGDSPIFSELESISKLKKVGKASINIKKVYNVSEIGDSHIVYLPPTKKGSLPSIASALADKPILIICDDAKGDFGINFIEVNQKLTFQISKTQIETHKLLVSSALLSLGALVN
jgi:hypothetical protein